MKKAKYLAVAVMAFALCALVLAGCSSGGSSSASASASASSSSASASASSASSSTSASSASSSSAAITTFADLAGKVVITQADSAALEVLQDEEGQAELAATFAELQTIGDYNNAFMQLESGAVDAVACDLSIAEYQLSKNPEKFAMLATPLSEEHYGVGFALDNQALADQVTASLQKLDADGTIEELCKKYEEYGLTYDNWVLPKASGAEAAIEPGVTLTVGFDSEYPPYGFVGNDGNFTGFDLDLAKAVCDANGWTLVTEPIDWDAKDALLNSGTINCIWNGFTIEGREGQYAFSQPYMLNEQVIVVKK